MTAVRLITLAASGLLASTPSFAEDAKKQPWEASAELGYVMTSGNSETETLLAEADGKYRYGKFEHIGHIEALNSSQNDERSAEKYMASAQSNYALGEHSYVFGVLTWETDKFSGYDYQASAAIGYGHKLIDEDNRTLSLELAPGYRSSKLETGKKNDEFIVRAKENFSYKFNAHAKFNQFVSVESGDSNTQTRAGVSLTTQIAGALSTKLSYQVKHNSDVPEGTSKTDRETAVTLVYDF